jgi:hypothetical protein
MKANVRCKNEKPRPRGRALPISFPQLSDFAGFAGHLAAAGQASAVRRPAGRLAADHLAAAGQTSGSDFDFPLQYWLKRHFDQPHPWRVTMRGHCIRSVPMHVQFQNKSFLEPGVGPMYSL